MCVAAICGANDRTWWVSGKGAGTRPAVVLAFRAALYVLRGGNDGPAHARGFPSSACRAASCRDSRLGATVLKAALVALPSFVLIVANEVFLTILLSLVFALGLDPLVGWFTGRGMGRGKAALLVFFLLFLAVFVIVVWAVTPVWNEVRGLVKDIPGYIDDLKDEPAFKQLPENTDAVDKAQEVATNAAKAIPEAASALLGLTGSLVGSVFSLVTLTFLTLFLLIGLPDFKRAASTCCRRPRLSASSACSTRSRRTISFSLLGNLAISVIAGSVVGVTAVIIGAPFPVVLALIVGLFDLIPQVGSLIAAVIVVSITLAGAGVVPAAILAMVILSTSRSRTT